MNKEKQLSILIVDDEQSARKLFTTFLQKKYSVVAAESISEAMAIIEKKLPDIIVTDVKLPGENGLTLLSKIKEKFPEILVILVTGHGEKTTIISAMREGAFDYLEKPILREEFLLIIKRAKDYVNLQRNLRANKEARENYNKMLKKLSIKLTLAEERERRRIATGLHDSTCQDLAYAKIKLGHLISNEASSNKDSNKNSNESIDTLNEVSKLISNAIKETRQLVFELSPPILYEFGYKAALESLADNISRKHDLKIIIQSNQQIIPIKRELEILIYQSIRELLINVVKHAQARNIDIDIKNKSNQIDISIKDDGIGFKNEKSIKNKNLAIPNDDFTGFGLFSIKERLESMGGALNINPSPNNQGNQGTEVYLSIPHN